MNDSFLSKYINLLGLKSKIVHVTFSIPIYVLKLMETKAVDSLSIKWR